MGYFHPGGLRPFRGAIFDYLMLKIQAGATPYALLALRSLTYPEGSTVRTLFAFEVLGERTAELSTTNLYIL